MAPLNGIPCSIQEPMAIFPQGKTAIERRCNPGERKLFHALRRHLTDDYFVLHDLPIGDAGLYYLPPEPDVPSGIRFLVNM